MAIYETSTETKKKIINACKKLFYEKGFEETTITYICELSGVNQGSIYYHYKTRKKLRVP